MNLPNAPLPPLTPQTALFLDFDGTLVELAPQPEAVVIPPLLISTLAGLYHQLGGALALVSGRSLPDLDAFVAPLQLPAAFEHGAQRRSADGLLMSAPATDLGLALRAAEDLVHKYPALRLERKLLALSLHYRQAPELEHLCLQAMRQAVQCSVDLSLMQGKCVIDVKPAGFNKGAAIAAFMTEAPFAGRTPIFAGDDMTDEDGFARIQRLGGHAIKVGEGPSCAQYRCASVAQLARWLESATALLHAHGTGAQKAPA